MIHFNFLPINLFSCVFRFGASNAIFFFVRQTVVLTHTLASLLAAVGGPGALAEFDANIVPAVLDCAPKALPVEFNADALVPLELLDIDGEEGGLAHEWRDRALHNLL